MLGRIEWASGLFAGVLGLAGLSYGIANIGSALLPGGVAFLGLMFLAVVGTVLGAYLHSQRSDPSGLVLLWIAAALLTIGVILAGFSIGLVLRPAAGLAVLAAVAGSGTLVRWRGRGG